MTSTGVEQLMLNLGVTKTHSRPHVSDDNPDSEVQFKTLKYRSDFPDRFDSIEDSRAHCVVFCDGYCHEHYHSGIALLTPASVQRAGCPWLSRSQRLSGSIHRKYNKQKQIIFPNKKAKTSTIYTNFW